MSNPSLAESLAKLDQLMTTVKTAFLPMPGGPPGSQQAGMPGGMDPAMMQGGGGGMDPAMMQGGAGMDPAMMQQGGAMPQGMDPAMMQPGGGGMPPGMDPAMMQQAAPQGEIPEELAAALTQMEEAISQVFEAVKTIGDGFTQIQMQQQQMEQTFGHEMQMLKQELATLRQEHDQVKGFLEQPSPMSASMQQGGMDPAMMQGGGGGMDQAMMQQGGGMPQV